jgi:hypothetical protein
LIYKLQLSLTSPRGILVYNKNRSVMTQFLASKELINLFKKLETFKIYAKCKINTENQIEILEIVDDKEW